MSEIATIFIEHTAKTPQIELNHITGELIFSGKSIPENAAKVYEPVLNWVSDYVHEARPYTNLRFDLDYFNTATLLWITKIIKTLIQIDNPDYVLMIHLYIPIEDFDEINEFDDIKDLFLPVATIMQGAIPCVGIKLYGKDDDGLVIKQTVVFLEQEKAFSTPLQ